MRTVLNISLPPKLAKQVKKIVKEEEFDSVSSFMRELIVSWLADQKLMEDLAASDADIKAGRVFELKSAEDLDREYEF